MTSWKNENQITKLDRFVCRQQKPNNCFAIAFFVQLCCSPLGCTPFAERNHSIPLSFILLNRITSLSCEMSTVKRPLIVNFTFITTRCGCCFCLLPPSLWIATFCLPLANCRSLLAFGFCLWAAWQEQDLRWQVVPKVALYGHTVRLVVSRFGWLSVAVFGAQRSLLVTDCQA